jgi:hypothetical protein
MYPHTLSALATQVLYWRLEVYLYTLKIVATYFLGWRHCVRKYLISMPQPERRLLLKENELLEHVPINSRQLRELRFRKKIPYIPVGHRTLVYNLDAVLEALQRLEIKETN